MEIDKMKLMRSEKSLNELVEKGKPVPYPEHIKVIPDDKYERYFEKDNVVLICETNPIGGFEYDETTCENCESVIYYRPYNKPFKHKICVECASKMPR